MLSLREMQKNCSTLFVAVMLNQGTRSYELHSILAMGGSNKWPLLDNDSAHLEKAYAHSTCANIERGRGNWDAHGRLLTCSLQAVRRVCVRACMHELRLASRAWDTERCSHSWHAHAYEHDSTCLFDDGACVFGISEGGGRACGGVRVLLSHAALSVCACLLSVACCAAFVGATRLLLNSAFSEPCSTAAKVNWKTYLIIIFTRLSTSCSRTTIEP